MEFRFENELTKTNLQRTANPDVYMNITLITTSTVPISGNLG
jgi:hypothetical protein